MYCLIAFYCRATTLANFAVIPASHTFHELARNLPDISVSTDIKGRKMSVDVDVFEVNLMHVGTLPPPPPTDSKKRLVAWKEEKSWSCVPDHFCISL